MLNKDYLTPPPSIKIDPIIIPRSYILYPTSSTRYARYLALYFYNSFGGKVTEPDNADYAVWSYDQAHFSGSYLNRTDTIPFDEVRDDALWDSYYNTFSDLVRIEAIFQAKLVSNSGYRRNVSSIIFSIKLNDYLDEIYNAIKEKYPTITCSVNGVNYTYSIENRLNYYIQYGSVSFPFKKGQEHTVSIY